MFTCTSSVNEYSLCCINVRLKNKGNRGEFVVKKLSATEKNTVLHQRQQKMSKYYLFNVVNHYDVRLTYFNKENAHHVPVESVACSFSHEKPDKAKRQR